MNFRMDKDHDRPEKTFLKIYTSSALPILVSPSLSPEDMNC